MQKAQNAMSNCLFALGSYISPMTNVLLTDLGLSIPLSFIDKCVSTYVDSTVYCFALKSCPGGGDFDGKN